MTGVMEGGGFYNEHAAPQSSGVLAALPLFKKVAREVLAGIAGFNSQLIVIADYGSSQGQNSIAPIAAALDVLRGWLLITRPVLVVHVDQPTNDFGTLLELLDSDRGGYLANHPNVFPYIVGRSFYHQVFPEGFVTLGWSSYAAVWLSRVPTLVNGHIWVSGGTEAERSRFATQAAEDWQTFLTLRAREMCEGGQLMILLPVQEEGKPAALAGIMDAANAELSAMVTDNTITGDERASMVLTNYARTEREMRAPFEPSGRFAGFTLEHCEVVMVPDVAWGNYLDHGSAQVLAAQRAAFFRATFAPTLAAALALMQIFRGQGL